MIPRSYRAIARVALSAAVVTGAAACVRDASAAAETVVAYDSLATAYAPTAPSPKIGCYVDFSTGMAEGMRATAEINGRLKDFLGGRDVACYKVGAGDQPTPISLSSPDANFLDPNNFSEPRSKLKVALDAMLAAKNRTSFFITDFERVDDPALRQSLPGAPAPHPIDASAWAQNDFREWLAGGNQIDVFAVPYQKPDYWFDGARRRPYPNWIYTIVFTPKAIAQEPTAFNTSVAGFLGEVYLHGAPAGAKHFIVAGVPFAIERRADAASGRAPQSLPVETFTPGPGKRPFEYYTFRSKDLVGFAGDPAEPDKRLIKAKIDATAPYLASPTYALHVTDVTGELAELATQINAAPPQVKSDAETGKVDTVANKHQSTVYRAGKTADSVFDLVYNTQTHEIGIKLKPEFAGVSQPVTYKVDVVLSSPELAELPEADSVLALTYAAGYRVRAFGESLRLALRDLISGMAEKPIYTFYIGMVP